jgi:hypothetical protein
MVIQALPRKLLLRRGDLLRAGLSKRQISAAIDAKKLTELYIANRGRAFFAHNEVAKLIKAKEIAQ